MPDNSDRLPAAADRVENHPENYSAYRSGQAPRRWEPLISAWEYDGASGLK